MSDLRPDFERLNRDSHGFRRSRKGTYTNPAIARDWKWFELGDIARSALSAAPQSDGSEDVAERFIQAAVDRAPEPLRRLGEYLASVLVDDQWATAERMLLGACEVSSDSRWNAVVQLAHQLDDAAQHITERQAYDFATQFRVLAGLDGPEATASAVDAITTQTQGQSHG